MPLEINVSDSVFVGNIFTIIIFIINSVENVNTLYSLLQLVVVENTASAHHVIVCTLCSCYPSSLLGMAPAWYKSRAYRARTVREPRAVLAEFGLQLPREQRIVVHDSTADCRLVTRASNEPSRSLKLYNHGEGPWLLVERQIKLGPRHKGHK